MQHVSSVVLISGTRHTFNLKYNINTNLIQDRSIWKVERSII